MSVCVSSYVFIFNYSASVPLENVGAKLNSRDSHNQQFLKHLLVIVFDDVIACTLRFVILDIHDDVFKNYPDLL